MRRAGFFVGLVLAACCVFAPRAFGFGQVPGSPFRSGLGPESVAFSPNGELLAVVNLGRYRGLYHSVSVFSVNRRTGALRQAPGSPVGIGAPAVPGALTFSPVGGMLVIANSGDLSVFWVNLTTGALKQAPGSPVRVGPADSIAFSPSGGLLAIADGRSAVGLFAVNHRTGAVKQVPGSPYPAGPQPDSVAFSPRGGLLAVGDPAAYLAPVSGVFVFSVDRTTGALTLVRSPVAVALGAQTLAFSPTGGLLAVADLTATVSVCSVDYATGALTEVTGSPFQTGPGSNSIAFSPRGGLLAVPNALDDKVSVFSVNDATGKLTRLRGSPVRAGAGPDSVAFSPDGSLLAVANVNRPSSISVYRLHVSAKTHQH